MGSQSAGENSLNKLNRNEADAREHGPRSVSSYRITREQFIRETSPQDRELLRSELNAALLQFLRAGRAVYCDGLGIFFPRKEDISVTHTLSESRALVREETILSAGFEKCYDLTSYHRQKFSNIAEVKEVSRSIYPRVPLATQIRWTERDFARYLRGLIRSIRDEVVIDGVSEQLDSIGPLYSLHNRQGDTPDDWFAGSDIFLNIRFREPVFVGPARIYERPVLRGAWELLEAAGGPACHQFEINLPDELSNLGYDSSAIQEELAPERQKISVAVFRFRASSSEEEVLVYCTDGLRSLFQETDDDSVASELVFQLAVPRRDSSESKSDERWIDDDSIPEWPATPLAMGWVLLQTSRLKALDFGAGLSCDTPIIPFCDTNLRTVFSTPFQLIRANQKASTGEFRYINLVGVSDDEAKVAELYGSEHLQMLLQFRKYDQITRPNRSSLISKTGLLPRGKAGHSDMKSADMVSETRA